MLSVPENSRARHTIVVVGAVRAPLDPRRHLALETPDRPFEILFKQFSAEPAALQPFSRLSGHATPIEWIHHEVVWIAQHTDEVLREVGRLSRGMHRQAPLLAVTQVEAVALRVRHGNQIRGDRSPVVDREPLADIVAPRTPLCPVPFCQEISHSGTVGLQDPPVASLGPRRFRQPPDRVVIPSRRSANQWAWR